MMVTQDPGRSRRVSLALVAVAFGVVFGIGSVGLAMRSPGLSLAGGSTWSAALELAAGWALIGVGAASWSRGPDQGLGLRLTVAGVAWFVGGWTNPGAGSSILFTVGLVFAAAVSPVVAHLMMAYPGGRRLERHERGLLGVAYGTNLIVIGLLPTLLYAPAAAGCSQCPGNFLAIGDEADVAASIGRLGLTLAAGWTVAAVMLMSLRLVRATRPARVAIGPAIVPGIVFLGLATGVAIDGVSIGSLGLDDLAALLWQGQAIALIALSAGVAWEWGRARRLRSRVAGVMVGQATSSGAPDLRATLASLLDDPSLVLAYRVDADRLVDHQGRSIVLDRRPGRAVTPLVRDGEEVALMEHRPGLEDDPAQTREVVAAARLRLDNERLQAMARARVADLRASRSRIVEAGDAERRRLERDLHDGTQQRLVSLSIGLRMLRRRIDPSAVAVDEPTRAATALLDQADDELRAALIGVREVAHGMYPAVLGEEGLAAGIEAIVEASAAEITVDGVPEERFDPLIEVAGYLLASEGTRQSAGHRARIAVRRDAGRLIVDVEHDGDPPESAIDLEDRIGALDGTIMIETSDGGGVQIHAEIPCES